MSRTDEIPEKVRELMDLHGPGIPHYSIAGRYSIVVYPDMKGSKTVTVTDVESGQTWQCLAE